MRAPSRRDGLVGMHNIARFRIVEDHHAPLVIRPKHLIYGHFLRLSFTQSRNSVVHNALPLPPSKAVIWYVTLVHLVANTPMKLTLWGDNIRARLVTDVVTSWREALRGWMSANSRRSEMVGERRTDSFGPDDDSTRSREYRSWTCCPPEHYDVRIIRVIMSWIKEYCGCHISHISNILERHQNRSPATGYTARLATPCLLGFQAWLLLR